MVVQSVNLTMTASGFSRDISKDESLHKRFLKRNLAHVGLSQCMNALADKVHVHKQEVACMHTVVCTL